MHEEVDVPNKSDQPVPVIILTLPDKVCCVL